MQTLAEGDRPSVQEQVLSSIRGAVQTQTHRLSVELNPPELGKVVIRFEQQEGSLSGVLEVDNRTTRAEVEQALPQILQNLHDSGIQVRRLDVVLNDQHPQSFRDGSSAGTYQGHQGQQDPGHPWPYMEQAAYPDASLATPRGSPEHPGPQVLTGGGSINLLV
jgi:flagellar hook-length control protein FliK